MCKNEVVDFDSMTDEEMDRFFAPRKTNSDKSLLPLFVYLILKEHSDPARHLSQKQIMNYLAQYPYELKIERKALSRCLHLLSALDFGVYSDPAYGTWIER